MIEEKGTLREQMMRCYLVGYITQRHNDYKIVAQNHEFDNYKEFKILGAKEKLKEYGLSSGLVRVAVAVARLMERTVSFCMCLWMLLSCLLKYLSTSKQTFKNRKFYPKLNYQEKRIINIFGSAGYKPEDITIIDIPGQYTKYEIMPKVSVFSGISCEQLWKAFVYSVRTVFFMKRKFGKDDLLFRSYSSFPFYLCFFFVSNLDDSNELVFVNHYDRWMYMCGNSHLHKTYVQHGKLWYDHIKRINCDVAYYLSRSQKEILEYTLFCNKPEAHFRKVFDYSGLEKLKNNGKKDLLIVCLTIYADRHEGIVEQLNGKGVNIYLKPHPGDNLGIYEQLQQKYPDIVVLGKFDYPKVDYVVSYDSTLADEYEMHDIPVLLYTNPEYERIFNEWFG